MSEDKTPEKAPEQKDPVTSLDQVLSEIAQIAQTVQTVSGQVEDVVKRLETLENSPVVKNAEALLKRVGELHDAIPDMAAAASHGDNAHASRLAGLEQAVEKIKLSLRGITH